MQAVAVGGGHGLSRSLQALRDMSDSVTAIVTVADDGGSSGRLRHDLGVAPPGDLRMALSALAQNRPLASLLQYRFRAGELEGHALGNLMIVAMADLASNGLIDALDTLCGELEIAGHVLPCTTSPMVLHAAGADGDVAGQSTIAKAGPPQRLWLEPSTPTATPRAVAAIKEADLIVLGPGSIYTSILPNLLVPGIARAIADAKAPVVLVGNMREQPGETEGMTLRDHVDALVAHVPTLHLDVVVAHDGVAQPSGPGQQLHAEVLDGHASIGRVVTAALLDGHDGHDVGALARAFGIAMQSAAA